MASDIWLRTILIVREETRCRHMGYSFRLAARVLLYAPSHRQDSTYHSLWYTSRGALAEKAHKWQLTIPATMAQWLCHRLMNWHVLGSHLDMGSNPERVLKGPVRRCKATHYTFSLTNITGPLLTYCPRQTAQLITGVCDHGRCVLYNSLL